MSALRAQEDQRAISRGAAGVNALCGLPPPPQYDITVCRLPPDAAPGAYAPTPETACLCASRVACRPRRGAGPAEELGARAAAAEVSGRQLREELTFPADWGPTEWVRGLSDALVRRIRLCAELRINVASHATAMPDTCAIQYWQLADAVLIVRASCVLLCPPAAVHSRASHARIRRSARCERAASSRARRARDPSTSCRRRTCWCATWSGSGARWTATAASPPAPRVRAGPRAEGRPPCEHAVDAP